MSVTKGVIVTATGSLIRAGDVPWDLDGSFDATDESFRTDVPTPPRIRGNSQFPDYHQWDGAAWILKTDVNTGSRHIIASGPPPKFKISLTGKAVHHMRIKLEKNATVNFLDAEEGAVVYLLLVQDSTGGRTLTIEYRGIDTLADYPPAMRGADAKSTIIMTRFLKRLYQVGKTNLV